MGEVGVGREKKVSLQKKWEARKGGLWNRNFFFEKNRNFIPGRYQKMFGNLNNILENSLKMYWKKVLSTLD